MSETDRTHQTRPKDKILHLKTVVLGHLVRGHLWCEILQTAFVIRRLLKNRCCQIRFPLLYHSRQCRIPQTPYPEPHTYTISSRFQRQLQQVYHIGHSPSFLQHPGPHQDKKIERQNTAVQEQLPQPLRLPFILCAVAIMLSLQPRADVPQSRSLLVDLRISRDTWQVLCLLAGMQCIDEFLGLLDQRVRRGGIAWVARKDLVQIASEV